MVRQPRHAESRTNSQKSTRNKNANRFIEKNEKNIRLGNLEQLYKKIKPQENIAKVKIKTDRINFSIKEQKFGKGTLTVKVFAENQVKRDAIKTHVC